MGGVRDLSVADRLEHVVSNGSRIHPQLRKEYETGYTVVWSQIPYSMGAFAQNPGPNLAKLREADGRIYLGCAAASESPGWMEGAFSAAWNTIDNLHKRVMA